MLSMLLETTVTIGGEQVTYLTIPESLLYALLGFIVTFAGIVLLIFMIWAVGKIMRAVRAKEKAPAAQEERGEALSADGEIPSEVKAAIVVAIAAYYEGEQDRCEFRVRKIKRL